MNTDRIEKKIFLRAPRARVWNALADARQFGAWFGVEFEGPFQPGARLKGRLTIKEYSHMTLEVMVERVEPETLFSYRWHPYAVDPNVDYSREPTTLVTFELEDAPEGTLLTIVESGFDGIPAHRRDEAFRMNDHGWTEQTENIARHDDASR